jgi:prepilin-type N-terminal cleavage/methylation domain-containing protein/prepilin-type processing-associated H-X9-DG protein
MYRRDHEGRTEPQGFTLIELLVVIAIISILAAILFPVFSKAREKARQTTCASNEKQIGLALLQYEQDFDECHVCWEQYYNGTSNVHWQRVIYSYVESTNVYVCPSNPSKSVTPTYAPILAADYGSNVNSVGGQWFQAYNVKGCGPFAGGGGTTNTPFLVSQFSNPSNTIDVEEINDDTSQGADATNQVDFEIDGVQFENNLFAGHTGGSNYLFVDGHVKWLKPFQTMQPGNNMWTIDNTDTCSNFGGAFNRTNALLTLTNAATKYQ